MRMVPTACFLCRAIVACKPLPMSSEFKALSFSFIQSASSSHVDWNNSIL